MAVNNEVTRQIVNDQWLRGSDASLMRKCVASVSGKYLRKGMVTMPKWYKLTAFKNDAIRNYNKLKSTSDNNDGNDGPSINNERPDWLEKQKGVNKVCDAIEEKTWVRLTGNDKFNVWSSFDDVYKQVVARNPNLHKLTLTSMSTDAMLNTVRQSRGNARMIISSLSYSY